MRSVAAVNSTCYTMQYDSIIQIRTRVLKLGILLELLSSEHTDHTLLIIFIAAASN